MANFRSIRRQLELTQVELAQVLGVEQSTISRMDNGQPLNRRTDLALEALMVRKALGDVHSPIDMAKVHIAIQSNPSAVLDIRGGAA